MKSLWKSFCSLKMSTVFAVTTALTFFFLSGDQAFAEGLTLPFVTILTDLQNTLVNEVAPVLAVLGIAILGFGLFTGQLGDGVRRILIVIIALSCVMWASQFVNYVVEGV